MGIRGLTKFCKQNPQTRCAFKIPAGSLWGLDISCLLYRAAGAGLNPLTVLAGLLVRFRKAGADIVVVLDGKPPQAKTHVLEERRQARQAAQAEMRALDTAVSHAGSEKERTSLQARMDTLQRKAPSVTASDRDQIKQFLWAAGVRFCTAAGEADDLLAWLVRQGFLTGVLSTDTDLLARGVERLVIPETEDGTVLIEHSLSALLRLTGLTYGQFLHACQFMGSDYVEGTMQPVEAFRAARLGRECTNKDAVARLRGDDVTLRSLLSEKELARFTAASLPPREPATVAAASTRCGRWPREWLTVLCGDGDMVGRATQTVGRG